MVNVTPAGSAAPDLARSAWSLMYRFVEAQGRRAELAETLGFRLGGGRGKILVLLRDGSASLGQLAEAVGVDASYATLIVDKLESRGLVERRPDPQDRRRKLVSLTPEGAQAVASADAILTRPPPAIGTLAARELEQLTQLLGRLVEADGARRGGPPGPSD